MTAETPCENTQVRAPSPHNRKRCATGSDLAHTVKVMDSAPQKKMVPAVANQGWGDLFKNKENFVEMHLC